MSESSARLTLDALLSVIDAAVARVRSDGTLEALNDRMTALLETLSLRSSGCPWTSLPIGADHARVLRDHLESGVPTFSCAIELAGDGAPGRYVVRAAREIEGDWIWVLEDETPRLRAEAEVGRLHRLRTVGEALHGFVHDLNNSLGVVMGLSESYASGRVPTDHRKFFGGLASAAGDAAQMLRFVADFALARHRRHERIALPDFIDKLTAAVAEPARRNDVRVDVRLVDQPSVFWSSSAELAQVCIQLLRHAITTAGPDRRVEIVEFPIAKASVAFDIRVDGDATHDEGLARLLASPSRGTSTERLAGFRADVRAFLEAWLVLLLNGGRIDYRPDRSVDRVFRVAVPRARGEAR